MKCLDNISSFKLFLSQNYFYIDMHLALWAHGKSLVNHLDQQLIFLTNRFHIDPIHWESEVT